MKNTQAEEALIRKYLTESEQGALESVFSTETNEAITNRAINKGISEWKLEKFYEDTVIVDCKETGSYIK